MKILGLTGSIGMGKSYIASLLKTLRIPVFDADAEVHKLLAKRGKAVKPVARHFPVALKEGGIERKLLAAEVFNNREKLRLLEQIIHPLVRKEKERFIRYWRYRRKPLIILEIPLLYEFRKNYGCDKVLVVTASHFIQKKRVMQRPDMTESRFRAIKKKQLPDSIKRCKSDFLLYNGQGKAASYRQLKTILWTLNNHA